MVCVLSCLISLVFVIGMVFFYNRTGQSNVVQHYKKTLTTDLQRRFDAISMERRNISIQGYALGALLSLVVLFFFHQHLKVKSGSHLACVVFATAFVANYFFYLLHPKQDWMLNHLQNGHEVKAWLQMYREMQVNYHTGLVLGLIGAGVFAFAFRC